MERLTRLRTPLTVAGLVALTLVVLARVGLGLSELGPGGSRAVAAARLAPNGADGALTLLAGLLVVSCFLRPEVAARRRLAGWGVVLVCASVVATLVALSLTDLEVAGWGVVWLVPDLVVPVLVGVALAAVARGGADSAVPAPASRGAAAEEPAEPTEVEDRPDPELQPSWPEDAAAGAVWRTAGEAARGAPAAGWGSAESSPWAQPALPAERSERPDDPGAA